MKPPFNGTDFPSLKRAITSGRYTSIPRKYSENLGKVIGFMLKLNPRDRFNADKLLKCDALAAKLQLDEGSQSGVSFCNAENNRQQLLQTILVPHNLRQLNRALPKPCYPEQHRNQQAADKQQPAATTDNNTVAPPLPPTQYSNENHTAAAAAVPSTHQKQNGGGVQKYAAHKKKDDNNSRKPLAAVPENHACDPIKVPSAGAPAAVPTSSKANNNNGYAPSAPPTNSNLPSVQYAGRPGRLNLQQYNSAVNKYSHYGMNGHANAGGASQAGGGAAGVQSRVHSHRIW